MRGLGGVFAASAAGARTFAGTTSQSGVASVRRGEVARSAVRLLQRLRLLLWLSAQHAA